MLFFVSCGKLSLKVRHVLACSVRVVAYMNESTSQMCGFYHGGVLQIHVTLINNYYSNWECTLLIFILNSVFLLYFGANVSLTETLQPDSGGY